MRAVIGLILVLEHVFSAAAASERDLKNLITTGKSEEAPQSSSQPPATSTLQSFEHERLAGNRLDSVTRAQMRVVSEKAYPLMAAKWPFNAVFICWENPTPENLAARSDVRAAISQTWEHAANINFYGWEKQCTESFVGVRILIADDAAQGAQTKYLGKYLAYDSDDNEIVVKSGMILNFTFKNWNQTCQNFRDQCIRALAVHEFGHAIGLSHEQNRPDTPNECTERPDGPNGDVLLTPWDPKSVMNYCNIRFKSNGEIEYMNNGKLSDFDTAAVQYIYGQRTAHAH